MTFDTEAYIELFFQDAEEHIQLMTEALLVLEKKPDDLEALSALFRAAHTIKSSSAMVGFMHISEFTHRMEDLIGYLRDTKVTITSQTVDLLFQAFDTLKEMMSQLQDEATEAQRNQTKRRAEELIQTFHKIIGGEDAKIPQAAPAEPARMRLGEETRTKLEELRLAGERIYEATVYFVENVQMASTRAFLIINNLAKIGTVLQTMPDLENEAEVLGGTFILLVASPQSLDSIQKAVNVSEVERSEVLDVTDSEQFEWPQDTAPEKTPVVESVEKSEGESEEAAPEKEAVTSFDRREDRTKTQTVRVNIEKLDSLLNLAAEMVIQRGRSYDLAQRLVALRGKGGKEEELLDSIVQQGMILTQLQETIMEARMVPIGTVFARFRRVVRDLAHNRGKNVNLVIEGEETELDKKIIDQIGDPLMHMIRNSVDHGIETPEERRAAGKSPEGRLYLNAIHQGNSIVITVQDDGKGIDSAVLRKKAVEKGLLTSEEAATLSEKDSLQLIFRPGFSTAAVVTDISGRGVGMDVVRRSLDQLGGTVDIDTKIGVGTTFYLKVPLTLAIIQALLVEAGEELYALPISSISETLRISKADIFSVKGRGNVIRLRDNVVPILNLRNVVNSEEKAEIDDRNYVAVLRHGDLFVGLIVDRMVNEQEIVIKSLSGSLSTANYIAGAAILGDGRVILILDIASLIERSLGTAA